MNNTLLEEVKSFINFTWEDQNKENRIIEFINSSQAYLNTVAGTEIDFNTDYLARELLFNRVLYMDSHALDDFGKNYSGMLEELKIAYAVNADQNSRKSVHKQDTSV